MSLSSTVVRRLAGLALLGGFSSWSMANAQLRIVAIGDSEIAGKGVSSGMIGAAVRALKAPSSFTPMRLRGAAGR
jgi:hypothetical protein